ncbi:class II aldolase/adducin family protein [Archaeoglobus veneficus]|uniref:Class II aldolase/adducin family protein n=1 Tax=Archaeoglobus veneficus (strain DSM 11195 / SNP6) TaxID=693661 RepID=F2KRL5_ARCVS|nr:class II aldolase/adducin family protein [Archaeoglobus veneficus]AEA46780.1 class II aldolase/adducin family protein [Archaeoglobus veneficus SNP6]
MLHEAIEVGRKLAAYRLIDGASGNLSFRNGDTITITKTGVMLDELDEDSFVTLKLGERSAEASSDLVVHEAIYRKTDYKAVLHCHGIFNVVLSFKTDKIMPVDLEGRVFIGEARVVEGRFGSEDLAAKIAEEVAKRKVAIVRGHGIYVASENLKMAFRLASYLEHSCEILYRLETLKGL